MPDSILQQKNSNASGKTGETRIKSTVYLTVLYHCYFFSFDNGTMVIQNANIRGSWVNVTGNSLYYFFKFSISLILYQKKKVKKKLSLST